jgi:transposase-like protein
MSTDSDKLKKSDIKAVVNALTEANSLNNFWSRIKEFGVEAFCPYCGDYYYYSIDESDEELDVGSWKCESCDKEVSANLYKLEVRLIPIGWHGHGSV